MYEVYKHAGEEMAAVWEYYLTTLLDQEVFVLYEFSLEDIHQAYAVIESNYDLETSWMKCHWHGLLLELLIYHQLEAKRWTITPYLDSLVRRTRRNQVLLYANIHSWDRPWMKGLDKVEVESLNFRLVH